ncbi:DJ-1 family glyoxalase III [uncultured Abyssibacter sp.]|uniref:DJ-1 family glyoxalase III n=1 Tax=uncultured Abyssibacter sp. TaxID=2320202 RepID=UPI0032B14985
MPTALVAIADGSEDIESVTVIDVLRRADVDVTVASCMPGRRQIEASRGTRIEADALIDDCRDQFFDAVVLPGGMPGAEHLGRCDALMDMAREQLDAGRLLGAICAAPAVALEPSGLLARRRMTCFPSFAERVETGTWLNEPVVRDGALITSQGPGTAIAFALALVGQLVSPESAERIGQQMLAPAA